MAAPSIAAPRVSLAPGDLRYDQASGAWVLRLRPDVAMVAKRLLPRLPAAAKASDLRVPHREDLCCDLAYLVERFGLVVPPHDRDRLDRGREAWRVRQAAVAAIVEGDRDLAEGVPASPLAIPARAYQKQVADLALLRGGLLCADELGLGKTVSGIELIARPGCVPAVVVTETHLVRQWVAELKRFAPHLRVAVAERSEPHGLLPWDVLVLNYHKVSGWAAHLARTVKCVVFDEAQNLRRENSQKWIGALALAEAARVRLGLSATPVYNYGGEIWAVLRVLLLGELGSYEDWSREWDCHGPERRKHQLADPQAFNAWLLSQGMMLRRTRADVGRELPACLRVTHTVDADPQAFAQVQGRVAELARAILARAGTRLEHLQQSGELDRVLRQATGIAKAPYVAAFVRMLVEAGEPVVLFGWHRAVHDLWQHQLRDLEPACYTGEESPLEKDRSKAKFLNGQTDLLIISLRSGAGLDGLQARCRTCVFGELDWSPAAHAQCEGRIHRDGQQHGVTAYYLVAEEGSDPTVAGVLGLKRAQQQGLIGEQQDVVRDAQPEDRVRALAEAWVKRGGGR